VGLDKAGSLVAPVRLITCARVNDTCETHEGHTQDDDKSHERAYRLGSESARLIAHEQRAWGMHVGMEQ
jgi:hypothetical protein